jgi:pyridoxal phosphate enzyme (YggS family)
MQAIIDNLARVRQRIADAAQRAGRDPADVQLVGVSKYVSAEASAALVRAGCTDLGESRPQQLWDKAASAAFEGLPARWHMIGHLQRNKVARTVPITELIHSVDSPRLLQAINDAAALVGKRQRVLLEVNCSGESAKSGLTADELREMVATLAAYPATEVCGLMTMAAGDGNLATAASNFRSLRELRDALVPAGVSLPHLSMGMSGDFEVAIAEGATIVRVGSALWEGIA